VSKKSPLSRFLKENPKEKLLAIVLACILWFAFGYQGESVRRDFIVPIEYLNMSSEWTIEEPKIIEAKLTLMGPSQAFQLLNPATLKISLNLSQIHEGRQEILLTREMINNPSNISVVGIKPGQITLVASRMVSIEVPIKIITENAPPKGYYIQGLTVLPPSIEIFVPSRLRYARMEIKTEPIDLSKINTTRKIDAKLIYPPEVQFNRDNRDISSATVIAKIGKINK
jgi:YbbR domain-containing protein